VVRNSRGTWEIALSGEHDRVMCRTFEEARRMAYLCAAHEHPCELVVLDAYHRVLQVELIDADEREVAHSFCNPGHAERRRSCAVTHTTAAVIGSPSATDSWPSTPS
jgi:hypothetical protein